MAEEAPMLAVHNSAYGAELYESWVRDPESVPEDWRRYFKKIVNGAANPSVAVSKSGPSFRPSSIFNPPPIQSRSSGDESNLQDRVDKMIQNFRGRGHMIARINPLQMPRPVPPELDPAYYGIKETDLSCKATFDGIGGLVTIGEILERLRATYCQAIGIQYLHIQDAGARAWLEQRLEKPENHASLSRDEQLRILTLLTDAAIFEEFIRKKFPGAKSFSLEGSESLIPLLDLVIEKAATQGVVEIVFGMAHRGRLNVLATILGKSPRQIFREFADVDAHLYEGRGDVKYHLGHSGKRTTSGGKEMHLSLCFNPSHLEFVNPVVLGRVRAKQDRVADTQREQGLAVMIHGDAAMAGEGIIQETLNLSRLNDYRVGGTVHVVVNNQLGFTTAPEAGRSTEYATDVARMLPAPIFHVNGEDPEAVARVVSLAMDFRKQFKEDVFIDMYAYRRFGHNETDEPSFTQPVMYRAIAQRKNVRESYVGHLLELKGVTQAEADQIAGRRRENLEAELSEARSDDYQIKSEKPRGFWKDYVGGPDRDVAEAETGVDPKRLAELLKMLIRVPEGFHLHPKLQKILEARRAMAEGQQPLDWAAAEALAFASLAMEGYRVRLSGQDSGRGTFSQRHGIWYDFEDGHPYVPLQNLAKDQAPIDLINSPLSEAGVLGFEYGYTLDWPDGLILWEAQFGDFVNAAQVILDQFITSAEDKWGRLSGLVLLLPHGFEGMGPEHSSARLERFLALAAEDNIQVAYPTTPAQYFHCLRRQTLRRWRKPLILMTPKSMLRHPAAVSSLDECARGKFEKIISENNPASPVKRLLLCTGKIFYELAAYRKDNHRDDVAIVRLEQLYPLQIEELRAALNQYPEGVPAIWVQEEPENMGAWRYMRANFGETLIGRFPFSLLSRPESASPATGSHNSHQREQEKLIGAAFGNGESATAGANAASDGEVAPLHTARTAQRDIPTRNSTPMHDVPTRKE